mmetsp:Transcript_50731/g.99400  ORF Transcript_50731/g.99400 Transcript_50731/m.99400 type:complete len:686 (-) Transcript_50731:116-2173(-)|eukprot:CAMPEP_0175138770 /NCGR_PEP_ID=MMETSP0087-20121206/10532_1 /TAXON_ID=136419 /ORGANISM="Unknown Unknown, Strain D1" /LENGTH=685 /DNA_ID=CAMNT_0016421707 /DNA_START=31 /DNA_END=2088 /DNA_ORIENTATION=+
MRLEDELQREFSEIDMEFPEDDDGEALAKAVDICQTYKVDAVSLAAKFDSFVFSQRALKVTIDMSLENLTKLESQVKAAQEKQTQKAKRRSLGGLTQSSQHKTKTFNSKVHLQPGAIGADLDAIFAGSINSTTSPDKPNNKRKNQNEYTTPAKQAKNNRRHSILTPTMEASPESESFNSRTNEGEIVCSLNAETVAAASAPSDEDLKPDRVHVSQMKPWTREEASKFRYMFQDEDDKRTMLDNITVNMMDQIRKANPKPEAKEEKKDADAVDETDDVDEGAEVYFTPVGVSSQEAVVVGGRLCCDEGEKLKPTAVLLEGDKAGLGVRMKLRMGLVQQYALFPGQVICAKGMNTSGQAMVVESILEAPKLPHRSLPVPQVEQMNLNLGTQPLSIIVAAGPFTTTDSFDMKPLSDLLARVRNLRPDAVVFLGPFLPSNHQQLHSQTRKYQDIFLDLLNDINLKTADLHTKILIVPSQEDVHAPSVFPQPPFSIKPSDFQHERGKFTFLPNPATFTINDITFGVCNRDVLFEIGKAELQQGHKGGRIERLAQHLVSQQSYYPLFPGELGSNVDYTHADKIQMPVTPDVLILPSRMKYFAHEMDKSKTAGAVCLNPASLAKGSAGGTYAHITVHPRKDDEMEPDEVQVKPEPDDNKENKANKASSNAPEDPTISQHHVMSRMRVDILRI